MAHAPKEEMELLRKSLKNSVDILEKLENEFGFFSEMGRPQPDQRQRAKLLKEALMREEQRMDCLIKDLDNFQDTPRGEVACPFYVGLRGSAIAIAQQDLARHGLACARRYIFSRIENQLATDWTNTGRESSRKPLKQCIVDNYTNMNRYLNSAMAHAGRAAEFLRTQPLCTWSRHQCHAPTPAAAPTSLQLIAATHLDAEGHCTAMP